MFNFQHSQITQDEFDKLAKQLIKYSSVYATSKFDVGKISSSLHLPLKPDAVFKKQRASKVPIHLHDKVNRLLDILEQYKIISPVNKEEQPKGNTFINPVIILAKGESLKIVLDARYLNSLIDESKCNWPIEPIQVILTKINGKYFTTADMNSAYNQMPLDEQSRRLTQFVIGNQQYEFNRIPIFCKNKVHFVDTLSRRTYFWDSAVPCGSENSHNVVQLNPDEDKYYLLTPYPTLMQSLKKFSPERLRAIARNPNIDLQSIGIYSKSDIQHHIRTQQFQELLTQIDTIQRQSIDQNLRKLAETAGFADIYTQDYSGYFKDIKDYIYLNGEKYRPPDISPINIFSFVTLKNEILDFLGWPYYILEKLTILYAMFNFI